MTLRSFPGEYSFNTTWICPDCKQGFESWEEFSEHDCKNPLIVEIHYNPETFQIKDIEPKCDGSCEKCRIKKLCETVRLILKAVIVEKGWFEEVDTQ